VASRIAGFQQTRADPTVFTFFGAPMAGRTTAELEQAVYALLDSIKVDGVTAHELAKARNQIEAEHILDQQQCQGQGFALGSCWVQQDWHYVNTYLSKIRAVTNEDIRRAAQKYFTEENRTVATLVPPVKP